MAEQPQQDAWHLAHVDLVRRRASRPRLGHDQGRSGGFLQGDLDRKLAVKAHRFSAEAMRKIQAAGGSAEVLGKADQ